MAWLTSQMSADDLMRVVKITYPGHRRPESKWKLASGSAPPILCSLYLCVLRRGQGIQCTEDKQKVKVASDTQASMLPGFHFVAVHS